MRIYGFSIIKFSLIQGHFNTFIVRNTNLSNNQKQWITFKVSPLEMRAIEEYCQQTHRTKTDILRDLIRRLPTYASVFW